MKKSSPQLRSAEVFSAIYEMGLWKCMGGYTMQFYDLR